MSKLEYLRVFIGYLVNFKSNIWRFNKKKRPRSPFFSKFGRETTTFFYLALCSESKLDTQEHDILLL